MIVGKRIALVGGLGMIAACHHESTAAEREAAVVREVASLQRHAQAACICQRGKDAAGKAACSVAFNRVMAPKHATISYTSCDPVSETALSWRENGADRHITLSYQSSGGDLCTLGEAKMVEDAMNAAIADPHNREKSQAADRLVAAIVAGKKIVPATSMPICG